MKRTNLRLSGLAAVLGTVLLAPVLYAQAPGGLTVKTATSKRVDLSWSGGSPSYTVQRRVLGGSYSNIAGNVTTTTYSDTAIDAFTTYQYQIIGNLASGASSPSNQVTVGPPPQGFTNAVPAPGASGSTVNDRFAYDLTMTLDSNGDPAFAFIFYDPNGDSDAADSRLEFRSWNRALYKWNDIVDVVKAIGGDTTSHFTLTQQLVYDAGISTFVLATELTDAAYNAQVVIYTSTDGVAWTKKTSYAQASVPSVAMSGGTIHLAYLDNSAGLKYVTGKLSADPTTWQSRGEIRVPGVSPARGSTTPSIAVDSAGNPGIAWIAENSIGDFNMYVMFWRPAGGAVPVKAYDSQGHGTDAPAVKLVFSGTNPRILGALMRGDAEFGVTLRAVKSDDGGATWKAPVVIPPDGHSSTDYPFDLAVDSQGRGIIAFGQNGGSGDAVCGNPKIARSNDFVTWKTCDVVNDVKITGNYSVYPGSVQAVFGGNDKVYLMWWDDDGIDLYREPPAGAITGPNISSVVNGATFQPGIVAGSWTTILGANLSDVTRMWGDSDFTNGPILPTNLSGVSVKINGLDAPVYFVSPGQINVQAPASINGNVNVVVTHSGVASNTATANAVSVAPGLFTYALAGKNYPSALYNGTFTIIGDPALYNAAAKAKAGDIIQLYATGLGTSPAGNIISSPLAFNGTVTCTIGTTNVPVLGAALVAVGEFQVNIQIPSGLPDGEYPLTIKVGSATSQSGVVIPITH
jgi:uncharacterized protein (TIGR03437 family)